MTLIDADALYELIDGDFDFDFYEVPETKRELLRRIDKQKTIDVIPIVRCKDCKYYEETNSRIGTCLLTISGTEVDGLCAWGERNGNEAD